MTWRAGDDPPPGWGDRPLSAAEAAALNRPRASGPTLGPGGAIMVRPYWAGHLFREPARIVCPLCHYVSDPFHDLYHMAEWVQNHYGECPGLPRERQPP